MAPSLLLHLSYFMLFPPTLSALTVPPPIPQTTAAPPQDSILQLFTLMMGDVQFDTFKSILKLNTVASRLAVTLAGERGAPVQTCSALTAVDQG